MSEPEESPERPTRERPLVLVEHDDWPATRRIAYYDDECLVIEDQEDDGGTWVTLSETFYDRDSRDLFRDLLNREAGR